MNNDYIFKYSEKKANKFNLYCLLVIAFLGIVVLILNEVNIFTESKIIVRIATISLVVLSLFPVLLSIFYDFVLKRTPSILEREYFKILILVFCYISAAVLCTALSYHADLFLAIPPLMAAQYRRNKKMFFWGVVASILLIIVSVYGSFLFGAYDGNMLKGMTKEESYLFENRWILFISGRYLTIFLHYILPKMIAVTAIDFIGFSITRRTSEMIDIQIKLSNDIENEILEKSRMQNSVIEHLADIIESRDIETGEHIKRTKKYVSILVNKMKTMDKYKDILTDEMCDDIINGAQLHDIGKIVVSDLILRKPGKLTSDEFEQMKIHTVRGGEIIKNILNDLGDEDFLNVTFDIATSHHEKWNGTGYPYNRKGEDIPLPGRIMAIADVFDALVAERVYKKPMPVDEAIDVIIDESGTHFDPDLIEIFKEVKDDFKKGAIEKL